MPQVIGTNVAALNAQRNLSKSQDLLTQSVQRLSSGLRINGAKDDAAGLTIAARMSTQVRGLQQAMRNANDAISLAQTAEGAVEEITSSLQRIRELAVQAVNPTNNASDRAALDAEAQQRIAEIDRIASQTTFNGLHILDGTLGTASFQVGSNAGETVAVQLSDSVRSSQIGRLASSTGSAVYATGDAATVGSMGIKVGSGEQVWVSARGNAGANEKAAAIRAAGISGLQVEAINEKTDAFTAVTLGVGESYDLTLTQPDNADGSAGAATTIRVASYSAEANADNQVTIDDVIKKVNEYTRDTGVVASKTADNKLKLASIDGRDFKAEEGAVAAWAGASTDMLIGKIKLSAAEAIEIEDGSLIGFSDGTISPTDGGLASSDIKTVTSATDMVTRVDGALAKLNDIRATLGAVQNRFESTMTNLQTGIETTMSARSRIVDADFATETSNLTRAQILQQAGTAMLAQANQVPQGVLRLLQ